MFTIIDRDTPLPTGMLEYTGGPLKLRPAADYDAIPRTSLRLWCAYQGRYGLPTRELVDWLRALIGPRKAIEVGAGHGDLAHHLGIPATDSKMQTLPAVKAYYGSLGQSVIRYPSWVEELEAEAAIERYQPEVVIGSWVTHFADPHAGPHTSGCFWGLKEDRILERGVWYVVIGNRLVHGNKPILQRPHQEFQLPFIRSRASRPEEDRLWIWPP